jgi:hypothetical protein
MTLVAIDSIMVERIEYLLRAGKLFQSQREEMANSLRDLRMGVSVTSPIPDASTPSAEALLAKYGKMK